MDRPESSDIEGKAAMGSGERAGKRTSFKSAGANESTFRSLDATLFFYTPRKR